MEGHFNITNLVIGPVRAHLASYLRRFEGLGPGTAREALVDQAVGEIVSMLCMPAGDRDAVKHVSDSPRHLV